jgi:hypothetical protein
VLLSQVELPAQNEVVGVLQWGAHEQIPADVEKGEEELGQLEGIGVGLEGFSPSLSTVLVGRRDTSELESKAYRATNYIRIACRLEGHPKLSLYSAESFWGRDDLEASLPWLLALGKVTRCDQKKCSQTCNRVDKQSVNVKSPF